MSSINVTASMTVYFDLRNNKLPSTIVGVAQLLYVDRRTKSQSVDNTKRNEFRLIFLAPRIDCLMCFDFHDNEVFCDN